MNIERLSLDQLRVFVLVAETGSFTGAARKLHRAQSAVSYAVTTLEQQLGVELFDRSGYRPQLTAAGHMVLGEARTILERSDRLQARARAMAAGLESELGLAVDVMFPFDDLTRLLRLFQTEFPMVDLRLFVDALGAVSEKITKDICQIGVVATLPDIPPQLASFALPAVTLIPVAAPDHPLSRRTGSISALDLHDELQLVLTDRSRLTEGRDFAVHARKVWRLGDIGTKHRLLLAGIGWGNMPLQRIRDDLETGRLQRLQLETQPDDGFALPLYCVYRQDRPQGQAMGWMLGALKHYALSGDFAPPGTRPAD